MAKQQEPEIRPSKPSIIKKTLIWGLTGMILVSLSVGGTLYLTGALERLGVENAEAANIAIGKSAKPSGASSAVALPRAHYLSLEPPFVVNFDDQGLLRYLQVNVAVMARDKAVIEAVQSHSPQIRYNLIVLFGSQNFATLNSAEGKEKLRTLALREVQSILDKEIGTPGIEAVYFTNFVMQ